MNNMMIGRRAVRTNWASRRAVTTLSNGASEDEKLSAINGGKINEHLSLEKIMNTTDSENTTVYLGNLNATATAASPTTTTLVAGEQASNSNSLELKSINRLINGILNLIK